ncbi:MAG: phage minor head protein [Bacteroidetes bacterium]|nr:phage minor head protein [Bacteroidota bacterium]
MPCCPATDITAIDLSGWDRLITDIAKQLQEGKIKPEDLNADVILATYKELYEGTGSGYAEGWSATATQTPSRSALLMQRNLFNFSGAKTLALQQELNSKLVKDGQALSWQEFKAEALKINSKYNLNHLQAEYETAMQSGKMAALWETFQRNKARYPNVKFKTQEDDRVREKHQAYNNLIFSLDDPTLLTFFPPFDWRCRCYPIQTAEPVTQNPTKFDIPEAFKNNVGVTRQVFSEEKGSKGHPYFAMYNATKKAQEITEKAYRKAYNADLISWAKESLISKTVNKEGVGKIHFTNKGIKEALNQPHKEWDEKNFALYQIIDLIENGFFIKSVPDAKGRNFVWYYIETRVAGVKSYIVLRENIEDGHIVFYSIVDNIK